MEQKKKMPPEQKFGIFLLILIVPLLFLGGCTRDPQAAPAEARAITAGAETSDEETGPMSPEEALDEIFADIEVRGVEEPTPQLLFEKFGVSEDLYLNCYARCSNGRYGLADAFIFEPMPGREDELREALEQVKTNRIVEFKNYDIYNALENAENGQIFQAGDYLVLIMIENCDEVRSVLELHLNPADQES